MNSDNIISLPSMSHFWTSFYSAHPCFKFCAEHSFVDNVNVTANNNSDDTDATLVYPLHHLALLRISGQDATQFLQGQLTADIETLQPGTTTFAAHCDAKGRMHANFFLTQATTYTRTDAIIDDAYYLQLPSSVADLAQKALEKYAVFSKVDIQNISDNYACFSLSNTHTTNSTRTGIEGLIHLLPNKGLSTHWVPTSKTASLVSEWASSPTHRWLGSRDWQQKMITAGIGFVEAATSQQFIPQMLNMDMLEGISFTKGCYTGQEIIARMKYRGSVNRRCYPFSGHNNGSSSAEGNAISCTAGQSLINEKGNVIGSVVNSVTDTSGNLSGLAVIKSKLVDLKAKYFLEFDESSKKTGPSITLNPLPYAITNN